MTKVKIKQHLWQLLRSNFRTNLSALKFPIETILPVVFTLVVLTLSPQSSAGKYDGEYSPTWSPDGKYLAYHKNGHGFVWDMVIKNLDSGEVTNITNSQSMEVDGAFSPDGNQLVYSARHDKDWNIYIYDIHAKQTHELVNNQGKDNDPMWSADGKSVLFISDRSGISQIHKIDLHTKIINQLTNTSRAISHLSLSDDGKYAIFDQYFEVASEGAKKPGRSKIYQLNLESLAVEHLYSGPGSSMSGHKVGHSLYFSNNRAGNWDIYRVDLNTGEEQQVIDGPSNEMKGVIDASAEQIAFSYFAPQGGAKIKVVKL